MHHESPDGESRSVVHTRLNGERAGAETPHSAAHAPDGWGRPGGGVSVGPGARVPGPAYDPDLDYSGELSTGPFQLRWEFIGPAEAEAMLGPDFDDLELDHQRISWFRRMMWGGRWELDFDAIGVDVHGRVVAGRHRLFAVVETGVRLWFLVSRRRAVEPGVSRVVPPGV
ncbi:hypothetical protein [Paludisphaera rhizosphaerae]|uniref:hypothetical protein n=1 Tax=Paludisphaera rhizosphaerae TaxID=2711216 RepID=UPI0013ECF8F1|nr:hypothetical protein [Paludisphaera rhizosphaerae]